MTYPQANYTVREIQQPGFIQTTPTEIAVNLTQGEDESVNIGNALDNGSITVFKFNDENLNGVFDGNETPLSGFNIYLDLNNNDILDAGDLSAFTGTNGLVVFNDLPAGNYTVREIQQPGFIQTTPTEIAVNLFQGEDESVNIGNALDNGSITVFKFNDENLNGIFDGNETPLSGFNIYLDLNNNDILDAGDLSAFTGTNGLVVFDDLPAGNYTVREIQQPGFIQTTPTEIAVNLVQGEDESVNIGNALDNGSITVFKFNDENLNGVFDGNETPLSGFNIYLDLNNNDILDAGDLSAFTGTNGLVVFNDLPAGNYTVREIQQPGFIQTTPTEIAVNLTQGEDESVNIGNALDNGSITVFKFNDENLNGVFDGNETPLSGFNIYLDLNNNDILDAGDLSAFTGTNGLVVFDDLPAGNYTVREIQQPGFIQTTPTEIAVNLTQGEDESVNIGNALDNGSITVFKFNDENLNGVFDGNETPLSGFNIYLDLNNNDILDAGDLSAFTGTNGLVVFDDLPAGNYTVREIQQPGFIQTTPTEIAVNLVQGEDESVNIGNALDNGSITVFKFNDENLNGVFDGNETPLSGFNIYLDLNNNDILDAGDLSAFTGTNGLVVFNDLPAGNYTVREIQQPGFIQTTPTEIAVNLVQGEDESVNIGNALDNGSITVFKFNDENLNGVFDGNETPLSGFNIYLDLNNNDILDAGDLSAFTGTNGLVVFNDLPAGNYTVREIQQPGFIQTTPTEIAVNLVQGEDESVNIGNALDNGSITVFKFNDENLNGVFDGNETPLSGFNIYLDLNNNDILDAGDLSAFTGTNGLVVFNDLPAGNYTVREIQQPGFIQTTPTEIAVNLTQGEDESVNIGNALDNGSITVFKFNDENLNGVFDGNETPLSGFNIYLDLNNNDILDAGDLSAFTGTNGLVVFNDLPAGNYTVREIQQPGFIQTTPTEIAVNLTQGEDESVNIGNALDNGSITVFKFNDENLNGVFDGNETPLSGFNIYLDLNNNDILDAGDLSAFTGTNGLVVFNDLPAGNYTVREIQQPGFIQTTPTEIAVNLTQGEDESVNIGNALDNGSITVFKFNDENLNGVFDGNETPLSGFNIYLDLNNNDILDAGDLSAFTGTNGLVVFNDLPAGNYTVREIQQPGFIQTTPTEIAVNLTQGEDESVNIGNALDNGSITVFKFNDENLNGVFDGNETPLSGFNIYLDLNNNDILDAGDLSAFTGTNGLVVFNDLPAGNYTVREIQQPGFIQTTPTEIVVNLAQGANQTVNVGNFQEPQLGGIIGEKFEDIDGDGIRDFGEPGIEGFIIYVDLDEDGVRDVGEPFAETGDTGGYFIPNLEPATYQVREEQQAGFIATTPELLVVPVGPGEIVDNIDFGNREEEVPVPEGRIIGVKFNDLNANGIQNFGEPGLQGVRIYLDLNENGIFDLGDEGALTSSNGGYSFPNLFPGQYTVREIVPAGFIATTPDFDIVNVTGNEPFVQAAPFGNRADVGIEGSIGGTVFADVALDGIFDGDEISLAGFEFYLDLNENGTLEAGVEPIAFSDGDGQFLFDNLAAGTYIVRQVEEAGFVRTSPDLAVTIAAGENFFTANFGNADVDDITGITVGGTNISIQNNVATATGAVAVEEDFLLAFNQTVFISSFEVELDDLDLPVGLAAGDVNTLINGSNTFVFQQSTDDVLAVLVGVEVNINQLDFV